MGAHMARNLAGAGFDVTLWGRSASKLAALSDRLGCPVAVTPRALSDASDVIVTMLSDDAASVAVHTGPDGLFAGSARRYVEMGTMSPAHIDWLAAQAPAGAQVIDAPVSGATQAAADAQLLIMAGCTPKDGAALMPIFDAMGRKTLFLGKRGNGAVMKLAVNSLVHGLNQTLAEAMALTAAAGIEAEAAFDVIEASAAAAPMLTYRRPLYLNEAAHDVTFTVALARKDMAVTADLARSLGTAMPQGLTTLDILQQAEAAGYGERDMAAILAFMRKETS